MHLRIDPVGKGRVVYFNYVGGGTPNDIRPNIILICPNETPVSHFFSGYPGSEFWLKKKGELGTNAYKKYIAPSLPNGDFEALYHAYHVLRNHTARIEAIFVLPRRAILA